MNQQPISNLSSPSQELQEPNFGTKKTSDSAPTPPKVSQLSALEQELSKLHSNRRNTAADATPQQVQSPVIGDSHVKTYSEVVQQQEQPQRETAPAAPQLTAEPPRVRKISRFAVSVVKEQQDAAALAKQLQHQLSMEGTHHVLATSQPQQQQPPQQQTMGAQIAAQNPIQMQQQQQPQMVMQQSAPVMIQPHQVQQQLQQQQSKPQLNLNLQGLTVQQQIPIQIQQQQPPQQVTHESSSSLKPLGKH